LKKEYEEFKTKYTLLEEQNKKINEDYNKLKEDFDKRQSTMQLTKIIDEPDESHTNTIEIITEKIIIEENKETTTTIDSQENKGPSKFKKAVSFNEPSKSTNITENKIVGNIETKLSDPSSLQSNEINNTDSKETKQSSFMNKIKMFSNSGTNTKSILKTKRSEEVKKVTLVTTAKKETKDKAKEQRMNKALQRIKKKREKSEDAATAKHDTNNEMFKSIKIKNMAELLEGQMNQNAQQAAEGKNENNANNSEEIKKEDITKKEEEENIDKMFDMIKRKSLLKRKKTKKKFEE